MNKQELLQLEKLSALTPAEIEKQQPAVFTKLNERAGLTLKTTVETRLKDASQEVKATLAKIDFTPGKLGKADVKALLAVQLSTDGEAGEKQKQLEKVIAKLPRLGKLDDLVQPDVPVFVNPVYGADLAKAKLYRMSDLAGLSQDKTDRAMAKELTMNAISSEKLEELVADKIFTPQEATQLGLASNLYTLFDSSFELAEYVKKAAKVQAVEDLIKLDKAAWLKLVQEAKVALPTGMKAEDYAVVLYKKVAGLFPDTALLYHIGQVKVNNLPESINTLQPLFERNEKLFGVTSFDELHTEGIKPEELKIMKAQYDALDRLVKLHPGLQLETVLNDKKMTAEAKAKGMTDRIGLIDRFVKYNAGVNFLALDYKHDSEDVKALNFQDFQPGEKTLVLNEVKSYQRVYSFTGDIEDTQAILNAGFHSGYQVTSVTLNDFIKATKLEPTLAERYYENAHVSIIRTTGVIGSIIDVITGSYDWPTVGNTNPDIKDYLKAIPGYQDMFGDLSFCDCEHCQSIYSPAAYFVDLMQFVQQHVLSKHFAGAKATHVLNLKVRRPDLWSLPLTCENTSTLVPYLDIINEILESYIAKNKGYTGDLNNHTAVEEFVYKREIALEKPGAWKDFVYAFNQPYQHPLESVITYLRHFEKTREDIDLLLKKAPLAVSQARLQLSDKEYQLITIPDNIPAFLGRVYGIAFTITAGKITPFNAQLLLKSVGVDRKELGRLIKTQFITNNGADAVIIQGEKTSADSIQNDIERIKNLTWDVLDRMHRFVRLWRKTGWPIEALDYVLTQLRATGIASTIDQTAITIIGNLVRLQEKTATTMEELSSIWYRIPSVSIRYVEGPGIVNELSFEDIRNDTTAEQRKSFLDQLFNHDEVIVTEGRYPKDTVKLIHPALMIGRTTPNAEFSSARLMEALNRSDEEVLTLIRRLAVPLGITSLTSTTEGDRGFFLNLANLSLLYRHAKLAEILQLPVTDFFRLVKLAPSIPNGYLENTQHIYDVMDFYGWWKTTQFSLDELNYILERTDILDATAFKTKEAVTAAIIQQTADAGALFFADTVFTAFTGITEEQSKQIMLANNAVVEPAPDGRHYWLKPAYDPGTALVVPAGITIPETQLRGLLNKYHPQYLVPFYLSNQLQLSEAVIGKLVTTLGQNLDADAYALELQGTTTPAVAIPALVEKLLPLSVLFKNRKFNADVLTWVADHLTVFDIANIDTIAIGNMQKLQVFIQLITIDDAGNTNLAALASVIGSFTNATQYRTADPEKLAAVLQTKQEQLATLHPVVVPLTNAIDALEHYKAVADTCSYIGIGGDVLPNIISTGYDALNAATNSILAAFRSKYRTESERKEKLEKYQDRLRGRKRASLTTYLTHSGFPQFVKEDDLFHYFLIDTELEGCARTSRLVAATMSLQLYVHRILLNLEQDKQDPGTPGRVNINIDPDNPANEKYKPIPEDEWVWRKNYRVWEANRKVFLYPENYIEPELRDDKSPLFKELEDELMQQEINADTVLDAYAKYMRGFDEVAHLKIAGCYHEKDEESETDVLHLFGVTADEPPLYYYRRVENVFYSQKRDDRGVVWNSWQKINVQIPVRKVAPITFNGRLHAFWVRITTLANTVFDENKSVFTGYSHKFAIEYTTLKLDGTWTPPQKLNLKDCYPFTGNGVVQDPLVEDYERAALGKELGEAIGAMLRSLPFFDRDNDEWDDVQDAIDQLKTPRYAITPHYEPIDEYTLNGFLWDQVYPAIDSSGRLLLTGAGYQLRGAIDFYNLNVQNYTGSRDANITGFTDPVMEALNLAEHKPGKIVSRSGNTLYRTSSPTTQWFDNFAYGSLIVNTTKPDAILQRHWNSFTLDNSFDGMYTQQIATLPGGSRVQIVNGAYGDAIIDAQGDLLLLQGTPVAGNGFLIQRMGTTLSETLTRTLFTSGVDVTLSVATQKALREAVVPISITAGRITNNVISNQIDFKGAYGNYYREIFFHIPFLIANHLNSQGKYAEAQKWYHYIFNPTANEVITFPTGATPAQKKKMEMDRNWQYLEFRGLDVQKLRDQLNDKQAIEVYKKDPFNPHAIARLRLSAYQKSIVMKYIDNLLDWGDQLFTQDTMESVNQATLLYIIAREILGDRPAQIGDCGTETGTPKTYENIQPLLNKGSEFLAELETYTIVKTPTKQWDGKHRYIIDNQVIKTNTNQVVTLLPAGKNYAYKSYGLQTKEYNQLMMLKEKQLPKVTVKQVDDTVTGAFAKGTVRGFDWKKDSAYVKGKYRLPSFGGSIVRQVSPVFCVPGNEDLLGYYQRVDDRLFKIRNCMNILGQRRQLALFAPEIDPRLLVRARAAGLSLDDILNVTSGNLPPYRFNYILEKAKAFTGVVQSFGASLLSAIEKKNGEELSLMRLTQQQNILEMSSKSRKLEIDSANLGIDTLNNRIESLNYQIGYYDALINENRNAWEIVQSVGRHTASISIGVSNIFWASSGIFALLPDLGSPFAMKWGGSQLGGSTEKWAEFANTLAKLGENLSASAGLEAGFDRRAEGWRHQKKLLQYELTQTQKTLAATEIRRDILIEAQKIHDKSIEHNNDVMEFYGEKFSNLGLYTWLSATMQRLYRDAFNNALAIAQLAEQAYRYERDDNTVFIDGGYFETSRGGLLAGERLLMSLQTMEKRYLETNYRRNEIDQAFSLTQINPAALLMLKQTGTCQFNIPEIFFDLFYPGQYRRKIQSIRLTIPSVTGPYTNVSATLSLMSSQIRMEPVTGVAALKDVPRSRITTIATSTAQNDAGVFQLNFRDDRYMPFEGAGAISAWQLSLPKNFRQFDYNTINDVIIQVSYTAEYDELFRDRVERANGEIETLLRSDAAPLKRMISLRQEFSNDFHRLTEQPANTPISFRIQNKHFPLFMNGRNLRVTSAKLILVTPAGQTVGGLNISLNTVSQTGFTADGTLGNLFTKDLGSSFFNAGIVKDHTISIVAGGDLAPAAGDPAAIDTDKLLDIVLYVQYKIG